MTVPPIVSPPGAAWSPRLLIILCAGGCVFSLLAGIAPLVVWGGATALGLLFWCFTSPVKGLTLVIALSAFAIRSTEEITPQEIVHVVLFTTFILGWICRRLILGQPFAPTRTDRLFIWFLVVCVASVIPAYFYGNSLLKWLRELIPFLFFIPYLLIVTSVRQTSSIRWLSLAFVVVCLSIGVTNIYEYYNNVMNAQYMWELVAGRRAPGEPLFFTTFTISMILIACEGFRGWRTVGYLALIGFCTVALAITFSRGYWVAAIVALGVAMVRMPRTQRRRMLLYVTGMTGMGILCAVLFMGQLIVDIVIALSERFETILSATVDLSLRSRIVESIAALERIAENPIWGYGLGYYYSYFPLIPYRLPTWYVHNVYIYLWLKLGILGLVTFLTWYGSVLVHGYRTYHFITDPFLRPLILGITSIMIAMIPLSVTSPQFIQKDSILFLALGMGFIELVYRNRVVPCPPEE